MRTAILIAGAAAAVFRRECSSAVVVCMYIASLSLCIDDADARLARTYKPIFASGVSGRWRLAAPRIETLVVAAILSLTGWN